MIYTVGIRMKYERAFAENRAVKAGRSTKPDGSVYPGGFAFKTAEDARAFLASKGLTGTHLVMGMEADWERDTAPAEGQPYRHLLRNVPLVKL